MAYFAFEIKFVSTHTSLELTVNTRMRPLNDAVEFSSSTEM